MLTIEQGEEESNVYRLLTAQGITSLVTALLYPGSQLPSADMQYYLGAFSMACDLYCIIHKAMVQLNSEPQVI